MQFIGLCRFSYPGEGGFQVAHASLEERIAYLYAPERLEERFRFLECFTLPSIRAQSDPDFTFLIVIGDSLPAEHRTRLAGLCADIPQVRIEACPPGPHRPVMKEVINAFRESGRGPCLQFRLDDDDAVAVDFVERLRRAAGQVAGLLNDHRHIAIDFSAGHIARPGPKGIEAAEIHQPFWTPGLAVMFRPGVDLSVMNFAHHRIAQKMPALGFPDTAMMLRGHNDHNDSRQGPNTRNFDLAPLDDAGEDLFRSRYNIDADHVRQVFGAD